tara:strand:+ start:6598 stop:7458 length:861 start_codon:yes stop_codon:yes gene_type:complete
MIEIEASPFLVQFGSFALSWHGLFSFIGVAAAVFLVGRWAILRDIDPDDIYSIAVWGIVGGIIGARLVHVIDNLDIYTENPVQIFAVWKGGIGLWGGLLGGFLGGAIYCKIMKYPIGVIADIAAPAMIFAQSIGRLGDIVNGEHCANGTDLFFGYVWTSTSSAASYCLNGVGISVQPVIFYEILGNFVILFVIWNLRNRLRPAGMLFALYLTLYSILRFSIQFFREDSIWIYGMQEAHFIAISVLIITIPVLVIWGRFGSPEVLKKEFADSAPKLSRAERRRRSKD